MTFLGLVELNWTFFFMIVNFLVLYLVLKKFLFKPVTEFMNNRAKNIEDAFKEAEDKKYEAQALYVDYKDKLDHIKEERTQIIKDATKRAEERSDEIIKAAQQEAKEIIQRANVDIARERQKVINDLKDQISTLAMMAASKVIEKELDEKAHQQLIQQFIDEVGDTTWQN
ncbi:F0F1 ATP synthase subunit B [Alkaliphilus serpentinus]|uniref:ATP synthase subunit b n=1 Tax=Alkaliphilus serpentinus TaxID=1482731 RepID=A0A833HPJ6_9FIRM|nr:F0F1 ATP synthase subunit B [Alkaliphilus serpentinus]KAB3530894.1 F0F1 ATP synthase subunit B [Alkaliphilus serpentinus]